MLKPDVLISFAVEIHLRPLDVKKWNRDHRAEKSMEQDPIQMKMATITSKCLLRQASDPNGLLVPVVGNEKPFTGSMKLTRLFTVELEVDQ